MILEDYEWTSTWIVQNENTVLPRTLNVGDSISQGYRDAVNLAADGRFLVNTISTSAALDQPILLDQIRLMWAYGFPYKVVHFNNGLHGWHLDTQRYGDLYERTIVAILEEHPDTKLILATSTPRYMGNDTYVLHPQNETVLARNEQVLRLADAYRLPVDDLYTPAVEHLQEWVSGDGYHFKGEGYNGLAAHVAASVASLMD